MKRFGQACSKQPACTVVVPAYNAARTIGATLNAARAQTIADIEIIVIDDGSRDTTRSIVADIGSADARVRLIAQANHGVSTARNAGILAARAPVIAFLDADDLWPTHHLATHLARLAADPCLGLSFSTARYIDGDGRVVGAARPLLDGHTVRDLVMANPTTTVSTWVARGAAFNTAGLFDTSLKRCEDQEWIVRAVLSGVRVSGTAQSVVDYRTSTDGLASNLAGMRTGYGIMLDRLTAVGGDAVGRHRRAAMAACDRYLARRALQLGLSGDVARHYILSALGAEPALLLRQPRSTLRTLLAAFAAARIPARA